MGGRIPLPRTGGAPTRTSFDCAAGGPRVKRRPDVRATISAPMPSMSRLAVLLARPPRVADRLRSRRRRGRRRCSCRARTPTSRCVRRPTARPSRAPASGESTGVRSAPATSASSRVGEQGKPGAVRVALHDNARLVEYLMTEVLGDLRQGLPRVAVHADRRRDVRAQRRRAAEHRETCRAAGYDIALALARHGGARPRRHPRRQPADQPVRHHLPADSGGQRRDHHQRPGGAGRSAPGSSSSRSARPGSSSAEPADNAVSAASAGREAQDGAHRLVPLRPESRCSPRFADEETAAAREAASPSPGD